MSDVIERRTVTGSRVNFHRDAKIEVYENGTVRIQQDGNPVDVVLLTARQVREIAKRSAAARQP